MVSELVVLGKVKIGDISSRVGVEDEWCGCGASRGGGFYTRRYCGGGSRRARCARFDDSSRVGAIGVHGQDMRSGIGSGILRGAIGVG